MRQYASNPRLPETQCVQTGVLCQAMGLDERLQAGRRGWCCRHYLEEAVGYADDAGYEDDPPDWLYPPAERGVA